MSAKRYFHNPDVLWRHDEEREKEVVQQEASEIEEVDDHGVVILGHGEQLISLNLLGAYVWILCDGSRSLRQIADELQARFSMDVSREQLERDVSVFLEQCEKEGLLQCQ